MSQDDGLGYRTTMPREIDNVNTERAESWWRERLPELIQPSPAGESGSDMKMARMDEYRYAVTTAIASAAPASVSRRVVEAPVHGGDYHTPGEWDKQVREPALVPPRYQAHDHRTRHVRAGKRAAARPAARKI